MSALLSGLLGLAVKVVPSLFKVLKADRQDGDVQLAALDAVKAVLGVEKNDPTPEELETAAKRLEEDKKLEAVLREKLSGLEVQARAEQERAIEAFTEIDKQFIELEKLERTQHHKQTMELFDAEQRSVQAARDHALDAAESDKFWVASIVPFLSIIIIGGFILTLRFIIITDDALQNEEVFYTAIGTLATAFATVIGFHFGSSAGSKKKDELILAEPATFPERDAGALATAKGTKVAVPAEREPEPRPDPGGAFGLFRFKVPEIADALMSDFGLTLDQAGGVLGNIGHECAGFRTMQEIKPIVPGSRGGWGWCQWTGPRRRLFEAWCQKNGFDNLSDDAANYGFLKHELETSEKRALRHLKDTLSLADATRSFMDKFERPGIDHFESRLNWAREAKKAFRASRN
ncbi:phage tail tip lysozyme [uncultured Roseobacter sp.]|uniref:phage tail tip lysozyme n=1 Tax=uncultured Roseobacter sp. TaxID=114847 RepID=UPI002613D4F5|nr:phage tail tip lysozyme [uncultured Roseobacter sp.]